MHATVNVPCIKSYFMPPAANFSLATVTVSAERMNGPTPAARVTWNTTVPPECVASVRVDFRTSRSGQDVVATYNTTNASQTEFIQTGLQCATNYYIRVVVVAGVILDGGRPTVNSREVLVEGNKIVYIKLNYNSVMVVLPLHRYTCPSGREN